MVRRASFQMRRLRCISATKSRDHCIYYRSSSAACSGGNKKKHQTKRQSIDSDDEADISGPRRENAITLAKTKSCKSILSKSFYPYLFD